ncbi:hypothetical protein N8529_00500, partial [bacterium]|nr:hypothetical protein [bacterium]
NPGVVGAANTFARCAEVTGTVDITGIREGTLYIPHGTFINQWTLTMTMSGPGQPDIVAIDTQDVNGTGRNFGWITSFNFVNKAGYDTITYNYTNADRDGSRARFMGVILVADGAGSQGLQVTDVNYIGGDDVDIELTFNSREGRTYSIFTSDDLSLPLESWDELDDSFPAEPDSDSSVFSVSLAPFGILPGGKQFFVVREN